MNERYPVPRMRTMDLGAVVLEPLSVRHAAELFARSRVRSAKTFHHLFFGPFATAEELVAWIESEAVEDRLTFCIVSPRLGGPVGTCSLMNIDRANGAAEIGSIWCVPAARGSEVITSAVLGLLVWLFDDLGYRRAVWKCDVLNGPSRGAAEGLGFSFEGIFRNHLFIRGRSRDTAWYSIIDSEWPEVRAHLCERLERKRSLSGGG